MQYPYPCFRLLVTTLPLALQVCLYMLYKELRFAISLPFSAADDAENGRLSATSICHAPVPFDHAPTDPLLLPQATNTEAPTSFVS